MHWEDSNNYVMCKFANFSKLTYDIIKRRKSYAAMGVNEYSIPCIKFAYGNTEYNYNTNNFQMTTSICAIIYLVFWELFVSVRQVSLSACV